MIVRNQRSNCFCEKTWFPGEILQLLVLVQAVCWTSVITSGCSQHTLSQTDGSQRRPLHSHDGTPGKFWELKATQEINGSLPKVVETKHLSMSCRCLPLLPKLTLSVPASPLRKVSRTLWLQQAQWVGKALSCCWKMETCYAYIHT